MEDAGAVDEVEVLDEIAGGVHGLGADAGATFFEIVDGDFGDETLEGLAE